MTEPLPEVQRLADISPKAYEHPADRAATAALQSIPMLDTVVRKLIEFGYERALRQVLLAGSGRLGAEELRTVVGHEAGHVLSDHVLYSTALMILLSLGAGIARMPLLAGLPLLAVKLALLEWYRAAELSCDRAATLVNRDPLVTSRTLMVMAGGVSSRKLNLDTFLRQGAEYEEWEPGFDKLSRLRVELAQTHAFPVRRVSELMKWVRSGDYDRIMGGEYIRRGDPLDVRVEAGEAVDHYAERFRNLFKEAGTGVSNAGDKMADAAEKLGEWLRDRQ